jgi:hypothetical protein
MRGISRIAEELLASQGGLCSMELVSCGMFLLCDSSGNRVLRRTFRSRRNKITAEWRRLHNKKLYALSSSLNIIREIKSRRRRGAYRALMRKPEGRWPLGRSRLRWKNNIKMNVREVG